VLIGVISDVHCNAEALDWALADLEPRVDEILLAGDAVYEYRFSNEVMEAARRRDMPYVLGNHEIVLLGPHGDRARSNPGIVPEHLDYMASRPKRIDLVRDGKRICMVHASPWAPYDQYVYSTTPLLQDAAGLDDVDILVLGHTHIPMAERIGSTLVVNPGSLGEGRCPDHRQMVSYAVLDTDTEELEVVWGPNPRLVP
jgi:putative phosphoesterase